MKKQMTKIAMMLILVTGLSAGAASAQLVDFVRDFSGVQGENGLFYQYYYPASQLYYDMVPGQNLFGHPAVGIGWVEPMDRIASLYLGNGDTRFETHPGVMVDTAIVWESDVARDVQIAGSIRNHHCSESGDGVLFTVLRNNSILFHDHVQNCQAVNFNVTSPVNPSDRIYLRTNKRADDRFDASRITARIDNVGERPPIAIDDFYGVDQLAALNDPAPGVLVNDSDPDAGDTLTAVLVTGPSHARSFQLNSDGSFTYVPVDDYYGPDTFSYRASDGTHSSETATVNITVRQTCPTGGFITGGGRYLRDGRRSTFGFVARRQGTAAQGNLEFQDHDMGFNVAAGTLDSVYAPTLIDGSFSGTCRVNGVDGYTFFVQVHDRGQPSSNDDFSIRIYDTNGAQIYTSGGLLSGGNIRIHETGAVAGTTVEWFRDDDGDGYTVSAGFACTAPCPSCSSNPGAGPDCNDNDPNITAGTLTEWTLDNDGDGAFVYYGFSCTPPVLTGQWPNSSYGTDLSVLDGDGYDIDDNNPEDN